MNVSLLNYTKDPLRIIYISARTCYSSLPPDKIKEVSRERMKSLIKKIISSGHHSVLEHVSFTFSISGISRVCSHQLVRHRIASFSQQSQRYTKPNSFVTPDSIKRKDIYNKYEKFIKNSFDFYNELINAGIPKEDARFVLPNATKTNIVVTMNLRELMNASSVRLCKRAQWEIREVFERMKEEVKRVDGFLAGFLVPKCIVLGYCPEEESCGLMPKRVVNSK
jgi:thymidylate synthase (FAD)